VNEDSSPGVEGFWLQAFLKNKFLRETLIVGDRDEEALRYLRDVRCTLLDNVESYELSFEFAGNPFFEEQVLRKIYNYDEDRQAVGIEGQSIAWKDGMDLTDGGKQTFFTWITAPVKVPSAADIKGLGKVGRKELQEQLEEELDQGMTLKDYVIPHAVMWVTKEDREESSEDSSTGASDDERSELSDGAEEDMELNSYEPLLARSHQAPDRAEGEQAPKSTNKIDRKAASIQARKSALKQAWGPRDDAAVKSPEAGIVKVPECKVTEKPEKRSTFAFPQAKKKGNKTGADGAEPAEPEVGDEDPEESYMDAYD